MTAYDHGTLSNYTKGKCRCESCRAAGREYQRQWRARNPDKVKACQDRYSQSHREEKRRRTADWLSRNPGASSRNAALWRERNPDRARAKSIAWNRAHPEVMREVSARWRAANREQIAVKTREWARANPGRTREHKLKRRFLKRSAGVFEVTDRDWRRLCRRYDDRCAYCQKSAPLTMDHVVPLSRGGRHSIGNLLPACRSCNSSKNSRLLVEWRSNRKATRAA